MLKILQKYFFGKCCKFMFNSNQLLIRPEKNNIRQQCSFGFFSPLFHLLYHFCISKRPFNVIWSLFIRQKQNFVALIDDGKVSFLSFMLKHFSSSSQLEIRVLFIVYFSYDANAIIFTSVHCIWGILFNH